jgi:predicted O-methyltransferase YrrM
MYDFYFGTKEEIIDQEDKYLIFVKHMLPRWCNSIPDSEYLAIHTAIKSLDLNSKKPVFVETGAGASTIALLYHAMQTDGVLYSWDINGPKGAFLRSVFADTLSLHLGKNIFDHWKFVAYSSLSDQLGLDILGELGLAVDFCFLDSEHTKEVLLGETKRVCRYLREGAILAIDDANYDYVHTNTAYINMQRKKLGLKPIGDISGNQCDPFYVEVERFLATKWEKVQHLDDSYKKEFKKDIFWSYYGADREVMGKEGMEKLGNLDHRFDSWQVSKRRS